MENIWKTSLENKKKEWKTVLENKKKELSEINKDLNELTKKIL